MPCRICNSQNAPYQCASCKNSACYEHCRTVEDDILCMSCISKIYPQQIVQKPTSQATEAAQMRPKQDGPGKTAVMMLVLSAGAALIYFIGDYFIFNMLSAYNLPKDISDMISLLRSLGFFVVLALSAITVLILIVYMLRRRKGKV